MVRPPLSIAGQCASRKAGGQQQQRSAARILSVSRLGLIKSSPACVTQVSRRVLKALSQALTDDDHDAPHENCAVQVTYYTWESICAADIRQENRLICLRGNAALVKMKASGRNIPWLNQLPQKPRTVTGPSASANPHSRASKKYHDFDQQSRGVLARMQLASDGYEASCASKVPRGRALEGPRGSLGCVATDIKVETG
ncbi:predicted protein [Histoplasma capsulatum H143]|uniref:Uncharacterized protein n=1 Tax=Ajellomyces capsulatus (strain H143) TaxID=544712 RepID=C6HI64_AJECH|nr:predicted protein [Histoplasma capsulatum H143]